MKSSVDYTEQVPLLDSGTPYITRRVVCSCRGGCSTQRKYSSSFSSCGKLTDILHSGEMFKFMLLCCQRGDSLCVLDAIHSKDHGTCVR